MKHTLRRLSRIVPLGFALASLAQIFGLFAIPGVATSVLVIGLLVSSLLAFMLGDYTSKPAFRVHRPEPEAGQPPSANQPPAGENGPDWTYSTRLK